MTRYAFLVFSQPTPGQEAEYNSWYTQQHLPDVLRVPGFVAAQRFALAPGQDGAPAPFLAIYEIETDDPQRTLTDLGSRANTTAMPLSGALDIQAVKTFLYGAICDKQSAGG